MRRKEKSVRRGIAVLALMATAAEMAEDTEEKREDGAAEKEAPEKE